MLGTLQHTVQLKKFQEYYNAVTISNEFIVMNISDVIRMSRHFLLSHSSLDYHHHEENEASQVFSFLF